MANKQFMVARIKQLINKMGYESDLIDVDSLVDSTLTLKENWEIIKQDIPYMGLTKQNKVRSTNYLLQAYDINKSRSSKSQALDSKKQAKKTFEASELNKKTFGKWKRNPGKYDIIGIDSKFGRF